MLKKVRKLYHLLMERYHDEMQKSCTDHASDLAKYHFDKSFSHRLKIR